MRIQQSPNLTPKPLPRGKTPDPPQPPEHPVRDALVHIGREASREAIVGAALAGLVMVGDATGHPVLGRAAALGVGAFRGVVTYGDSAEKALGSGIAGKALAGTLGMGTALLCAGSGNMMQGIAAGALIGVIQSPKS